MHLGVQRLTAFGEHGDDLRNGKKTDQRGNDIDAARHTGMKDKPLCAHDVVKTDGRQPKPDAPRQKTFDHRTGIKRSDHRDAQDRQPEQMRRPKGQRPLRQHRSQKNQQQNTNDTANGRGQNRQLHRPRALAFLCHGMAIEGGGDIGGCSGYFQQDRAYGPARHGRSIGRPEQDQTLGGFEAKGERDQQGHGHGRRQTRCRAENETAYRADQKQAKIHRREHVAKIGQKLHREILPHPRRVDG